MDERTRRDDLGSGVGPDTPIRRAAKILRDHGINAVPVVDEAGAPISMASDGDLIGRDKADREARRNWWFRLKHARPPFETCHRAP
jgi:CBS-domain-containing membrane protein